jgi:hypothetical protein
MASEADRWGLDPQGVDQARSEIYWHLYLLAKELRPLSDGLRLSPPRNAGQLDEIWQKTIPLCGDLIDVFGHIPCIIDYVDDEFGTYTLQIRQLMELQVKLSVAVTNYFDVVDKADSARRSNVRENIVVSFIQFQQKIESIVAGIIEWRG